MLTLNKLKFYWSRKFRKDNMALQKSPTIMLGLFPKSCKKERRIKKLFI